MSQPGISFSSIDTQKQLRIEKMNKLKELGQDPFTPHSKRDYTLYDIKSDFDSKKSSTITLAGRIKSKRMSGKIAFATVEDESLPDGFQFIFKQDELPSEDNKDKKLTFQQFKDLFEEGDYIQATGILDESQRGEPSLFVHDYIILTKALRPLPDTLEYENFEARYLDRVADFKMNTKDENGLSVRDMVKLKSKYWQIWREEMIAEGFLEVETPVLRTVPSGAEAKPFVTHHNELNQEVYLRMEIELPQKRLLAGGFERVFEIGRQFRNEGSSPQHLQEYTQIEWYGAYLDYNYGMALTKRIYQRIVKEIIGTFKQVDYYGNEIDWSDWCSAEEAKQNNWELEGGWPKIKYFDAVRYFSNGKIDTENKTPEQLVQIAKDNGVAEAKASLGVATLLDKIWKKVRVNTRNPFFLILPPVELEPLAKRHPANPDLTERFQLVAGTAELGKGFSELNDPIDQYGRFAEQQKAKDAGNDEAMSMDTEYVEALEYGIPPMAGFGTSERLFSFLLGKHIKECVTFPAVRTEAPTGKARKTMVAHAVILNSPDIPLWSKLNAAAHLSAALGARKGIDLIQIDHTTTKDGEKIPMNIQHAIVMKKTDDMYRLTRLKKMAEERELDVTVFTEEMRSSSNDEKVRDKQESKNSYEINYLGVLVFGKKSDVEELTDDLELFE